MQPDPLFRENMAVLAPDFVDVLEWRRLFDALLDGDPRRDFGTYALELTIEPLFRQIKSSEAIMAVLAGDETVVLCQLTGAQRDMVAALRAGNAELFLGHARRVIAEFEETESFQHLRGRLGDVADLKFTVATKGFGIDVSAQGVSIVLTLEVGPDKSPELVHDLLSRIHQAIHAWHDAHVVHSSNCDTTPPARLAPKYPDDDDGA